MIFPELIDYYLEDVPRIPYVEFYSGFEDTSDGRCIMIWMIQPDGRYWADEDGFGDSNAVEVQLYAYVDENGKFLSRFRIYSIGREKYFGTDLEEINYQKFWEEKKKR